MIGLSKFGLGNGALHLGLSSNMKYCAISGPSELSA